MGFKCTPQIKTLVMAPDPKGKHTANGKKLLQEAGRERYTKSQTLDRSRSKMNRYSSHVEGFDFRNGNAGWKFMEETARNHKRKITNKDGRVSERSIGSNQAIAWAVIINPPESECVGWDDETYERFYRDSFEVLAEFNPVFRQENWVFSAEHFDEGTEEAKEKDRHIHRFGFAKDINGEFKGGNHIADPKSLNELNSFFPQKMRKRGWNLDDLDTTDFERVKTDSAYREERKKKWTKAGRDTNEYIAEKNYEQDEHTARLLSEIDDATNESLQALAVVKRMKKATSKKLRILSEKEAYLDERENALKDQIIAIEEKIAVLNKLEEKQKIRDSKKEKLLQQVMDENPVVFDDEYSM